MRSTGSRQIPRIVTVPNTPTVPRSTPADARMVSAASDRIPPTTGMVPDMANFVALMVTASALPAITPLNVRYPTKASITVVSSVVAAHFISAPIRPKPSFPSAAKATAEARYAYRRGISRPLIRFTRRSENRTAAICRTAAPVTAPVAAVIAATVGSSTLANEVMLSMVLRPKPSMESTSATATTATASAPTMGTTGKVPFPTVP